MSFRVWASPADKLIGALVRAQRRRFVGKWIYHLLCLRGTDVSPKATLGPGLHFKHAGIGVVIHSQARIGRDVTIYHGVTLGRADIWREVAPFGGFDIGDNVILGAHAALLNQGEAPLTVGDGAVIGAGAVVTRDVGAGEIWAGNPARRVGETEEARSGT